MTYLVTNVPKCVGHSAKTFGLQHLQFLNVDSSRVPPDWAYVVHYRTDELLVEQHTVSDGQATPVKDGAKHNQSLNPFLPTCLT